MDVIGAAGAPRVPNTTVDQSTTTSRATANASPAPLSPQEVQAGTVSYLLRAQSKLPNQTTRFGSVENMPVQAAFAERGRESLVFNETVQGAPVPPAAAAPEATQVEDKDTGNATETKEGPQVGGPDKPKAKRSLSLFQRVVETAEQVKSGDASAVHRFVDQAISAAQVASMLMPGKFRNVGRVLMTMQQAGIQPDHLKDLASKAAVAAGEAAKHYGAKPDERGEGKELGTANDAFLKTLQDVAGPMLISHFFGPAGIPGTGYAPPTGYAQGYYPPGYPPGYGYPHPGYAYPGQPPPPQSNIPHA